LCLQKKRDVFSERWRHSVWRAFSCLQAIAETVPKFLLRISHVSLPISGHRN
jgi:hypothetical protein